MLLRPVAAVPWRGSPFCSTRSFNAPSHPRPLDTYLRVVRRYGAEPSTRGRRNCCRRCCSCCSISGAERGRSHPAAVPHLSAVLLEPRFPRQRVSGPQTFRKVLCSCRSLCLRIMDARGEWKDSSIIRSSWCESHRSVSPSAEAVSQRHDTVAKELKDKLHTPHIHLSGVLSGIAATYSRVPVYLSLSPLLRPTHPPIRLQT